MKDFTGNPEFPIWLIGDSPPEAWADKLDTPLDPRHPARHSIWTSVADPLQDRLYRQRKVRLDTSRLYIRNAISQSLTVPTIHVQTSQAQAELKELFDTYKPSMVLTFGVGAFMASVLSSVDSHWKVFKTKNKTTLLGEEFRSRIENYDTDKVNIIPLLHTSIARGGFIKAYEYFVGAERTTYSNYFDYVGTKLADLLFAKFSAKKIWIE